METQTRQSGRLGVASVEDALDVVPHLVGFHPCESLVILVVRHGVVAVSSRAELRDLGGHVEVAALIEKLWERFLGDAAWFVAYSRDPAVGWEVLANCDASLPPQLGRRLTLVDGEHWWDGSPWGPMGRFDPGHGPLAAQAVLQGLPARASRAELAACFDGPDEAGAQRSQAALAAADVELAQLRKSAWPDLMGSEVARWLDTGELDDAQAARLARLAGQQRPREVALLLITGLGARRHLALWQAVLNRVPLESATAAVALAGMAAWVCGDGAVVSICLDKLAALPGTRRVQGPAGVARVPAAEGLSRVLRWVTEEVIPPQVWDGMRIELLKEASAGVRRAVCRQASRPGR